MQNTVLSECSENAKQQNQSESNAECNFLHFYMLFASYLHILNFILSPVLQIIIYIYKQQAQDNIYLILSMLVDLEAGAKITYTAVSAR